MVAMSHQQPALFMLTAWTCIHGLKWLSDALFTLIDQLLFPSLFFIFFFIYKVKKWHGLYKKKEKKDVSLFNAAEH